jgi:hypothetical protein
VTTLEQGPTLLPPPYGVDRPSLAPSLDELVSERPTSSAADLPELTAGYIENQWREGQQDLLAELRHYEINANFLLGEQWLTWNSVEAQAEIALSGLTEEGEDRLRVSVNRLRPAVRRAAAKLLRRPLVFDVIPDDADDASIKGANVGKAVLQDLRQRHGWEELRSDQVWEHYRGGTTLLALEWDDSAGDSLGYDQMTGKRIGTGDTREHLLGIAQVAFEPGCTDAEHARWWIMGRVLPPAQVQEQYQLPTKPAADATAKASPLTRLLSVAGSSRQPNLTLVLHYYERPNWLRPDGAYACVVNGTVIKQGPWQFPFKDRLNVVIAREIPNPHRWTGQSILDDAVSPQVAVNHGASSLLENAKYAGTPKFMYPEGSINADWLSDHPGEPLSYVPGDNGAKPGWESAASLPPWTMELPQRFEAEIDAVLGDYPVARGSTAGSLTSGSALALLAEQGDSPLTYSARIFAEAWGRFATLVMQTLASKITVPQTARVPMTEQTGAGPPQKVEWTGKDLHGQTEVVVPLEAVAPRTSGMSYQLARELVEIGLITTPQQFARLAEVPGIEHLDEITAPQLALAERENVELFTDAEMVPIPEVWHQHRTHIEAHNAARASARYRDLDEPLRRAFDNHVLGHEKLALEEALRMQWLAMTNPVLAGAAQASGPETLQDLLASIPGGMPTQGGTQPGPPQPETPPNLQGGGNGEGMMPTQPEQPEPPEGAY